MMVGHKWPLFCLGFRFIGWFLLGVITLGIGLLWIWPYYMASLAKFYEEVKRSAVAVPAGESIVQ